MKEPLIFLCAIVLSIIVLKVFFTLWRLVEKKLHPEKNNVSWAPEVAFKNLKGKDVNLYLKNGEIENNCKYIKTYYFSEGEFAQNYCVYFELMDAGGKSLYLAGTDVWKIETTQA